MNGEFELEDGECLSFERGVEFDCRVGVVEP